MSQLDTETGADTAQAEATIIPENGTPNTSAAATGSLLDMATPEIGADPKGAETAATTVVPEKYDLKLPAMPNAPAVSPEEMTAFTDFAKASNLSNTQAQAVLTYGLSQNAAAREQMTQLRSQWETSVKADKELGGNNLDATVLTANRAISTYDTSGTISQVLRESGYGSHPDVIRFLYNVGKGLGEDDVPGGGSSGRAELPLEERLYPTFTVKP